MFSFGLFNGEFTSFLHPHRQYTPSQHRSSPPQSPDLPPSLQNHYLGLATSSDSAGTRHRDSPFRLQLPDPLSPSSSGLSTLLCCLLIDLGPASQEERSKKWWYASVENGIRSGRSGDRIQGARILLLNPRPQPHPLFPLPSSPLRPLQLC